MMSKPKIWIAAMLFFLAPALMALGGKPEAPEEDVSRSRSVKIERQEKAAGQDKTEDQAREAGAAEKPAEPEKAGPDSEEAEKPVSLLPEDVETAADGKGAEADTETAGTTGQTAEQELGDLMLGEQEALFSDQERLYTRKGRVNPFEPFMRGSTEESGQETDAEIQRRTPQTPLEKIALSQLRLTAVLKLASQDDPIAMVEDPSGKGYVVKKGTWIGDQGGRVSEILSDRIIVQEEYKDVFGKIAEREIEKKLQK